MAYVSMKDGEPVPKEYDFLEVGLNMEAKESGITVSGKKLGPTN